MGKKSLSPKPKESFWELGRLLWLTAYGTIIVAFILAAAYLYFDMHHFAIFLLFIPLVIFILHWLEGEVLILLARIKWSKASIHGIIATSNSPNWKEYIDKNWAEKFGEYFVIVNYSEFRSWKPSLATRICKHFLGRKRLHGTRDFRPAVLLFRGLGKPYIYRFFNAFHDAKHGNHVSLEELERHLEGELEKRNAHVNSQRMD